VSRAAPRLVAAAGVLLVVGGVLLAVRGQRETGELVFLSTEQFEQLRTARRQLAAGRAVLVLGTVLLGSGVGWLLGRARRPRRAGPLVGRAAVLVGIAGLAALGAGAALVGSAEGVRVVTYSGSYEPVGCPGSVGCTDPAGRTPTAVPWTALGSALAGALLVGAVAGRGGGRPVSGR